MPTGERLNPTFPAEYPALLDKIDLARQRLIVALDVPTAAASTELVKKLEGTCQWFKVGLELFTAAGPAVLEHLIAHGHSIFLDLKFHDIPNTVAGAVRSAASMGVRMMTVHSAGGPAMLAAAKAALDGIANPPELLAVTVLTSMDAAALESTGIARSPAQQVELLAKMGLERRHSRLCLLAAGSRRPARAHRPRRRAGDPRNSSRRFRHENWRPETHRYSRRRVAQRRKFPGRGPPHHAGPRPGQSRRSNPRRNGRSALRVL